MVQELQERQLQKHDLQTVLPLLTAERIRRATQLNQAIATDLAARELTSETAGLEELFQAVFSRQRKQASSAEFLRFSRRPLRLWPLALSREPCFRWLGRGLVFSELRLSKTEGLAFPKRVVFASRSAPPAGK